MNRRGPGGLGRGWQNSRPVSGVATDFELVLIDGDNLLHRVRGMRDEAGLRWLLPRLRAWLPPGTRALVMLDGHPDPGEAFRRHVATGVDFQHSGSVTADTALVGTVAARPYADRARTVVVTDDHELGDRVRHVGGLVRRLDWLVNGLAAAVGDAGFVASPSGGGSVRGSSSAPPGGGVSGGSPSAHSDGRIGGVGVRPVGIGGGRRAAPRNAPRNSAPPRHASASGPAAASDDGGADGNGDGDADEREPWKPGRGATRKRGNPKREPKGGA